MSRHVHETQSFGPNDVPGQLSRRRLIGLAAGGAVLAASPSQLQRVSAQDNPPVTELISLSQVLCGGGSFDEDRAALLLSLIQSDEKLSAGLDELLQIENLSEMAQDADSLPGSAQAQDTAAAILNFWYASVWNGQPTDDRGSAYYGVTAWQAMYTPVVAVCKGYGIWAQPPAELPLVPANTGESQ